MALFKMPKRADSDAELLIHKAQEVSELKKRVKIKGTSLSAQLEAIARNVEETLGDLKEKYLLITTDEEWLQYCRNAVFDEYVSIDTETTGLSFNDQKNLVGVCIQSYNQKPAYIPYGHISTITEEPVPNQVSKEAIIEGFSILHKGNTKNIFHNAYYDVVVIYLLTGIMMPIHWDTQEAGKLLNENDLHNLKFLYDKYVMCGTAGVHKFNELFEGITFCYVPYKIGYIYAAHDAEMTMELFKFQRNYLTPGTEECNQCHLERVAYEYYNTELPCLDVLIDMKIRGIDYDMELNRKLHDKYTAIREETYNRYVDVCEKIHHEINNYNRYNPPIEFPPNAGSSQQMQAVFYKILGANPPTKKKKDNHTTNKKALKNWAKNGSEIVKELASVVIELKACEKCLNDFIDKLYLTAMEYGGKIHGNFKLNGAKRTGRLSSTDPNLQQIPSKTHDIRNPFNAGKGRVLVGMDYSQQEQKVLASLANEPKMIEAFRAGRDIYSTIASIAFDLPYEDCLEKYPDGTTNEEGKNRRGQAKAITLGGETPLMLEIA